MRLRWNKLLCALLGHDSIMSIDKADLRSADVFGLQFDIKESHYYCKHCDVTLDKKQHRDMAVGILVASAAVTLIFVFIGAIIYTK